MADNPKKKKQDAKRVSQQPWEQTYQKAKKTTTSAKKSASKGKSKEVRCSQI